MSMYSICVLQQIPVCKKSTFFICIYGTLTYDQQVSHYATAVQYVFPPLLKQSGSIFTYL